MEKFYFAFWRNKISRIRVIIAIREKQFSAFLERTKTKT